MKKKGKKNIKDKKKSAKLKGGGCYDGSTGNMYQKKQKAVGGASGISCREDSAFARCESCNSTYCG